MKSSIASRALALLAFSSGILAHNSHKYDWVEQSLPDCWQECLQKTSNGCDSSKCICKASQSDSYLPDAVTCAVANCKADDWKLDFSFLTPLQGYCGFVGNPIPDEIMSSARTACTATAAPEASKTRQVEHSESTKSPQSTTKGGDELTEVFTSTATKTTTNGDGQTLEIIVPVVMGPSTISFGKTVTSTLDGKASATSSQSSGSASASPSPTTEASAPTSTQVEQQPQAASSTTTSKAPQKTSTNNGSPFDNMQAGAERWGVPGAAVALGAAAAAVFMRL